MTKQVYAEWGKIIIALVSLVLAIILYLLFPNKPARYDLHINREVEFSNLFTLFYADLDGDRVSELIRCKKAFPVAAIVIENAENKTIRQWNLKGEWIAKSEVKVMDYDHDGFKELYSFTYHHDSIFLNVIEPMQPGGTLVQIPVVKADLVEEKQDWRVQIATPADLNGDRYDDLVFSIFSGFTLQPRKVVIYDVARDQLLVQKSEVGNCIAKPVIADITGDGNPEITGDVFAPNNYGSTPVPFSDSCSWLFLCNQALEPLVTPIAYDGSPSYISVLPITLQDRQLLVSFYYSKGLKNTDSQLAIWQWMNDSLVISDSKSIKPKHKLKFICADSEDEGCFYMEEDGAILKLNQRLEVVKRIAFDINPGISSWYTLDIDNDGAMEILVYSLNGTITIFRNNLRFPVSVDLNYSHKQPVISAMFGIPDNQLSVFSGNRATQLTYSKNYLYPFRYGLLLLFFMGYYLIFTLLINLQRRRIEAKHASEKRLLSYQLTNVMQQLDPHFLFNALTSISGYYHKGKKAHAQDYLAKISKLIRTSIENSEKVTILLSEEIQFVRDYLSVESIRMGERFDYVIDLKEELINRVRIPKMLIQNFVENAMKHGIRHLSDRKGMLRIYSMEEGTSLHICVEDNGVGRKKAGEIGSFGTGNGLNIVRKTLDIYEQLNRIRITFKTEDLFDDNQHPSGTRVTISIPIS